MDWRKLLVLSCLASVIGVTVAMAQAEDDSRDSRPRTLGDRIQRFGDTIFGRSSPPPQPPQGFRRGPGGSGTELRSRSAASGRPTSRPESGPVPPEVELGVEEELPAAPKSVAGPTPTTVPEVARRPTKPAATVTPPKAVAPPPETTQDADATVADDVAASDTVPVEVPLPASTGPSSRRRQPTVTAAPPRSEPVAPVSDAPAAVTAARPAAPAPKSTVAPPVAPPRTAGSTSAYPAAPAAPTPSKPVASTAPAAPAAAPATPAAAPAATAVPAVDSLRLSDRTAQLAVEVTGPRRISVGREATYQLVIKNLTQTAATDVVVRVALPDTAEILEARSTAGTSAPVADAEAKAVGLEWQLRQVDPQGSEDLTLKLVPRSNDPIELAVEVVAAPVVASAMVEVEEPKLELYIAGPREVAFGDQGIYKLTIANPGTGPAENVTVFLLPLSGSDKPAASHRLGTLAAGESKVVEVELTARQAGELQIRAEVTADGDLKATASEAVHVRRAELKLATTGPRLIYAGMPAPFEVRVENTGDAEARQVVVSARLPHQAEYVSSTAGGEYAERTGEVTWTIDRLLPGASEVLSCKCTLTAAGDQRFAATAAAGELTAAHESTTQVMARADLALEVVDTPGPVAVGQEVVYEVKVRNRGTKAADNVGVVAYFSDGIEPLAAEGMPVEIGGGAVQLAPIVSFAAGQEKVIRIRAKANVAGTHRLRVEVVCDSIGTHLTHEDTTFFYDVNEPEQTAARPVTSMRRGAAPTVAPAPGPEPSVAPSRYGTPTPAPVPAAPQPTPAPAPPLQR